MIECWKEINGYKRIYEISNLGRVKSLSRYRNNRFKSFLVDDRILTPVIQDGYLIVNLYKDKKMKTYKIHHIMGMVFFNHLTDGTTKLVIDHIDGNSLNNKLNNLQIITHRENMCKDRKNKNGYTGVSKLGDRYQSKIYTNGKTKHLGMFDTPEEAHNAYLTAKQILIR